MTETPTASPETRHWIAIAAALAFGLLIVVVVGQTTRQDAAFQSGASIPPDTVVATLQTSGNALPDDLIISLRAARAAPDDLALAKSAARALIAEGRTLGDSRLVGAAIGTLRPFANSPDAETLYLEATARQYQHDFDGALALLDRAIDLDPSNINAVLTRATILIVQGKLDQADAGCRTITDLGRPEIGFLCQSTALILTAQAPVVAERLAAILSQPGVLDPALHGWAIGLMGEIAAAQGDDAAAATHFATVIADDPLALRERLLLADVMLRTGQAASVPDLLRDAPDVDGVLIRRVMAAQALGQDDLGEAAELGRRFQLNFDLGLTAHAREEAMYFLHIAPDPAIALSRAQVNWALQHEIEDAQLLIDAAVAADDPAAAAPVLDWIADQQIVVPALRLPPAGVAN